MYLECSVQPVAADVTSLREKRRKENVQAQSGRIQPLSLSALVRASQNPGDVIRGLAITTNTAQSLRLYHTPPFPSVPLTQSSPPSAALYQLSS